MSEVLEGMQRRGVIKEAGSSWQSTGNLALENGDLRFCEDYRT
jgi:hypothetical protein